MALADEIRNMRAKNTNDEREGNAPSTLGLDGFVEPDDQGLSLDELGRAYAALLKKGQAAGSGDQRQSLDPYPEAAGSGDPRRTVATEKADDAPAPAVRDVEDAACPITPRSILEAILFVGHPANEPLAAERIATLMRGVGAGEIDELVTELNREYEAEGRPYAIVSVDLGYQLSLRPQFAALRDAFYGRIREARLSQSAIDVLAIVAYQQPITQQAIDEIRGKPCGPIVSLLVRRDLLAVEKPPGTKAKPEYRTTERFLDLFDLEQLSDLPRSHDLEREL